MAKDKQVIAEPVEVEVVAEAAPETIGTITFTDATGTTHYAVREA